jgi:hypothetical protein
MFSLICRIQILLKGYENRRGAILEDEGDY